MKQEAVDRLSGIVLPGDVDSFRTALQVGGPSCMQRAAVSGRSLQRLFHQYIRPEYALTIRFERVVLDQHGRQPAQIAVAGGSPRAAGAHAYAFLGSACVDRADVRGGEMAVRFERSLNFGTKHAIQPFAASWTASVASAPARKRERDVVNIVHAVGHVNIEIKIGIVTADEFDHALYLRAIGLRVI